MNHDSVCFRWGAALRAAVLLAAAAAAAPTGHAQKIDDIPPAVQNSVPPNLMFMMDTSGSMKNIVTAAPYDSTRAYGGPCPAPVPRGAAHLVVLGGTPHIRMMDPTTEVHLGTFAHRSFDPIDGRCFDNATVYPARLLASIKRGPDREPGTYLEAEYSGHFLNWYFGNFDVSASRWNDRKPGTETRMEVASRVTRTTLDAIPLAGPDGKAAVRIGLSRYRTTADGGALLVGMADYDRKLRATLHAGVEALTSEGSTPLASTLADIGRYFATGYTGDMEIRPAAGAPVRRNIDELFRLDGVDNPPRDACLQGAPSCASPASPKPIQYWCQRSSIFAVTDGRPHSDRAFDNNPYLRDYDGDCSGENAAQCRGGGGPRSWDRKTAYKYESMGSDYMDDVAKFLFDIDLRPDLEPAVPRGGVRNNVVTYVIGFADAAVMSDPLLLNTARQGGGKFIAASDGPALERAFDQAVSSAIALDAAGAAVSVTSARISAGTVGYDSSFVSGSWDGDVQAYAVDLETGLRSGPSVWSAKEKLDALVATRGHAARRIVSYDGTGVPFTTANGARFRSDTPALTDELIGYTRGDRTGEGTAFRKRLHLLGDLVNAEPVVVNYPDGPVVYQAGNDGMLHAFDGRGTAAGGGELWAYIPRLVHAKLAGRAAPAFFRHEFLVDGTPANAEIAARAGTRRILVGGLGKGGPGYYALDISRGGGADEADVATKVMWEVRPDNMGYSYGTPLIVNTAAGWRVVVSSGYRNDIAPGGVGGDGRGRVWVLDPEDGSVVKVFTTPPGFGSASDSLGLAHLARPQHLAADAVVRHIHGADLKGNVWRFDLDAPSGTSPTRIAVLRDGSGDPQPVSSPPVVAPVPGSASRVLVYVGTGQYLSIDDVPSTPGANSAARQTHTIYGIVDDLAAAAPPLPDIRGTNGRVCPVGGPRPGGDGDFVCQRATEVGPFGRTEVTHHAVDLAVRRGFYVDIPTAGARVNVPPALSRGGTLVVGLNVPTNVPCEPGGYSYVLQLSGATGGAVLKVHGGSEYFDPYQFVGHALASRTVIVAGAKGSRGLVRRSDRETVGFEIYETAGARPGFRRIYMRPVH